MIYDPYSSRTQGVIQLCEGWEKLSGGIARGVGKTPNRSTLEVQSDFRLLPGLAYAFFVGASLDNRGLKCSKVHFPMAISMSSRPPAFLIVSFWRGV